MKRHMHPRTQQDAGDGVSVGSPAADFSCWCIPSAWRQLLLRQQLLLRFAHLRQARDKGRREWDCKPLAGALHSGAEYVPADLISCEVLCRN